MPHDRVVHAVRARAVRGRDGRAYPGRTLTILLAVLTIGQVLATVLLVAIVAEAMDHGRDTLPGAAAVTLVGLVGRGAGNAGARTCSSWRR